MLAAELSIRPPGDAFTKPVGGSVVMTCSLDAADGDEVDDNVALSWLDSSGQEVTSVTGRYEDTKVKEMLLIYQYHKVTTVYAVFAVY